MCGRRSGGEEHVRFCPTRGLVEQTVLRPAGSRSTPPSDGQYIGAVKVSAVLIDVTLEPVEEPVPTDAIGDGGDVVEIMSPLVWQAVLGNGLSMQEEVVSGVMILWSEIRPLRAWNVLVGSWTLLGVSPSERHPRHPWQMLGWRPWPMLVWRPWPMLGWRRWPLLKWRPRLTLLEMLPAEVKRTSGGIDRALWITGSVGRLSPSVRVTFMITLLPRNGPVRIRWIVLWGQSTRESPVGKTDLIITAVGTSRPDDPGGPVVQNRSSRTWSGVLIGSIVRTSGLDDLGVLGDKNRSPGPSRCHNRQCCSHIPAIWFGWPR